MAVALVLCYIVVFCFVALEINRWFDRWQEGKAIPWGEMLAVVLWPFALVYLLILCVPENRRRIAKQHPPPSYIERGGSVGRRPRTVHPADGPPTQRPTKNGKH